MAINKGWDGSILVTSSALANSTEIANLNNWEISFNGDALEKTAFAASVKDRTFDPGLRSHTISFSGYLEDSKAANTYLLNGMKSTQAAAARHFILLHERETSLKAGWKGNGVITNLTVGTPIDGLQTFSGAAQISGGLSTYDSST